MLVCKYKEGDKLKERMKKEYTAFNKNLKTYREKTGISATEFAKLLGISKNTYMPYETQNREPSFAILIKIANLLNISVDELIGNKMTELDSCIRFFQEAGFTVSHTPAPECKNYTTYTITDNKDKNTEISTTETGLVKIVQEIKKEQDYLDSIHKYIISFFINEKIRYLMYLHLTFLKEEKAISEQAYKKKFTEISKISNSEINLKLDNAIKKLLYTQDNSLADKDLKNFDETSVNIYKKVLNIKDDNTDTKKAPDNT